VPPERVARVVDALEHLQVCGRRPGLAPSGELTGPRELVREVLTVSIDEAAETLSGSCSRLPRGTGAAAEVRACVEELSTLLDQLDGVAGAS
jgi:hypothetical protein